VDWKGFLQLLLRTMRTHSVGVGTNTSIIWNPRKATLLPWIDVVELEKVYKEKRKPNLASSACVLS
jgi:hypothetical protein